jgi:hypothetical protein
MIVHLQCDVRPSLCRLRCNAQDSGELHGSVTQTFPERCAQEAGHKARVTIPGRRFRQIQLSSIFQTISEFSACRAAIGIVKGKPLAPDARMKKILVDAAAVGNATSRAISFRPRNPDFYFYPRKSAWFTPFVGGSSEFIGNHSGLLDARTAFFYMATGITPAMPAKTVGQGSQYAAVTSDADRNYLDGSKNVLPGWRWFSGQRL